MSSYKVVPSLMGCRSGQSGHIALSFLHFVLAVFFHATIFLVALVGLAHIWLPIVADYKWVIEKEVSDFVGNPVTIESIAVDWQSEAPRWVLNNLQLYDANDAVQIEVAKLYLTLDRRESLRTVRLQPRDVRVENVKFRVVQQDTGNFTVPGLVFPLPGQSNLELGTTRETPIVLTVAGGEVLWQAEGDEREVTLSAVQFDGVFDTRQMTMNLDARFPAAVGKALQLQSRLEQVDSGVWNGEFTVQTEVQHVAALPLPHVQALGITDAGLRANGEVKLRNNKPVFAKGELALLNPEFIQAKLPLAPLKTLSLEGSVNANSDDVWLGDVYVVHQQKAQSKIKRTTERSHIGFGILRKNRQLQLDVSLDRVDLAHYFPLLARQPWMPALWRDALGQMQPQGRLDKTEVNIVVDEQAMVLKRYQASGALKGLSFQESEQLPGLSAVDADFQFDERQGVMDFAVQDGAVRFRQWFEKDIPLSRLRFGLDWQQQASAWQLTLRDLVLENRDIQIGSNGTARLGEKTDPDVALDLTFATRRPMENLPDYLPSVIPEATNEWLKHAIIRGEVPEGTLTLRGNPLKYPFEQAGSGELDIRFRAENATLAYLPEWPVATDVAGELHFHNKSMSARVASGQIGEVAVTGGTVAIDNMVEGSVLEADVDSQSSLHGHMDYLQKTPVGKGLRRFIQAVNFSGDTQLNLKLEAPLTPGLIETEGVDVLGTVQVDHAGVRIPELQQTFSAINGTVLFDRYGVRSPGAQAIYQGRPLRLHARTRDDKQAIVVSLQQKNSAGRVLPATLHPWTRAVSGETPIQVDITLPSFVSDAGDDPRLAVQARSDLQGIKVDLPPPFAKQASETKPLLVTMDIPLEGDKPWGIRGRYADVLNAVYLHQDNTPLRAGVVLGKSLATLPPQGLSVVGTVPQLDALAWQKTLNNSLPGNIRQQVSHSAPQSDSPFKFVSDVTVKQLSLGETVLGHGRIRADTRKGLTFNLQSPKAQLAINNAVSTQLNQDAQVNIKLNNIDFKALEHSWQQVQGDKRTRPKSEGSKTALLPGEFPNVRAVCSQCRWGTLPIDQLRFALQRREEEGSALGAEMQLQDLELQSGHLRLLADGGVWQRLSPNNRQSRTSLSTSLQVAKPAAFLKSLGVDAGLSGGFVQADGQLAWQGSPFAFNARSLEGNVQVTMGAGVLTDVEPGMGRFLGLLDVQRLPRRLTGGFSDMTTQGMPFDGMKGDLRFKGGKVSTHNVVIRSPVMAAGIKGESDLIARTHNQRVTVIPKLESTVPVIGAVLGGVGVGAALALVNAVRKDNPEQKLKNDNSAFAMRYRVTGAWKDPQIDEVKKVPRREEDIDVFSE